MMSKMYIGILNIIYKKTGKYRKKEVLSPSAKVINQGITRILLNSIPVRLKLQNNCKDIRNVHLVHLLISTSTV
jgi:hypothetical protein